MISRCEVVRQLIRGGSIFLFFAAIGTILLSSCDSGNNEKIPEPRIPYPDPRMAAYLQAHVDSSEFVWFTDVKAAASSFCNEELPSDSGSVTIGDITVLGESTFHAKVEVHLPKKILILTMDRAFKEKGLNSIWQVVKMEEKKD